MEDVAIKRKTIMLKTFTLLVGVAVIGVARTDQSEPDDPQNSPIGDEEMDGERQLEVPEVVLQLKYDKGELNRIYLTQFRKDTKFWLPSVASRNHLCSDLCHAGLGGTVCGSTCPQMIPVGLHTALQDGNQTDAVYGQPRYSVCPALCENHLGEPLCNCAVTQANNDSDHTVNWTAVCTAFCHDGYLPSGCPACDSTTTEPAASAQISRILTTYEGWAAWCNMQCRQGQGGAACNCDRTPFQ